MLIALVKTRCYNSIKLCSVRTLSTSMCFCGKFPAVFWVKKRMKNVAYGEMADTPDWSFLDGRPAPPGFRATQRKAIQRQICERIIQLNAEINSAKRQINNKKQLRIKYMTERQRNRFTGKVV